MKNYFRKIAEAVGRKTYYEPHEILTKKQRTALRKNSDYQTYVDHSDKKVYVRPDDHKGLYHIANQDQKHVMRVHISRHGKIYGHRIDRKSTNNDHGPWIPIKTIGEF